MKKLLICFASWILSKWSVEPVCVKPGTMLCVNGHFYEIQSVTQTFEYAFAGTLEVKAEERIPMEVDIE